jgi:hypothetical protein
MIAYLTEHSFFLRHIRYKVLYSQGIIAHCVLDGFSS